MNFDYYQILQVKHTATSAEIKAAYRNLAKLFHPDKNPAAEEKFKQIKEAYETLIDTIKRSKYDQKRNYNIVIQAKKKEAERRQTSYNHTVEAELKRRQYYKEHFAKKENSYKSKQPEVITNNKELTSILISIPVAVALLLILVNIYQKPHKEKEADGNTPKQIVSEIKTSESPYKSIVGENSTQ